MKYHEEIYSEVILFNFIKYITFTEGSVGVAFLILYIMQLMGNLSIKDELPALFFLMMPVIMFNVVGFLAALTKFRIGITQDLPRVSYGFVKYEVP